MYDNFSSGLLDRDIWNVSSHEIRKDKVNTKLFIWVDSAATVNLANGDLNLSMLSYPGYTTTDWDSQPITANFIAGQVETKNYFSYGIYECNATFSKQRGSFPAFWLMSAEDCSSSINNEIDIVELKYEINDSPTLDNNIFYYPIPCGTQAWSPGMTETPFSWVGDHTYKCIWSPSKIEFWVDNTKLKEVNYTGQYWYPQFVQRVILSQQITMYNYNSPTYGIITPQTSKFHWIKVREFFLAPEITLSSDLICTSDTAILDVDPLASNITWSLTPAYLFSGTASGTGKSAPIVVNPYASGEGKITYSFEMPSGESFSAQETFWVGQPTNDEIDFGVLIFLPGNQIPINQTVGIGVTSNPNAITQGVNSYYWQFMSWNPYVTGYQTYLGYNNGLANIQLDAYASAQQVVQVSAFNTCGGDWVNGASKMFYAVDPYFLSFSPNPSVGETTISIEQSVSAKIPTGSSTQKTVSEEETEWDIEIYDNSQSLKLKKSKLLSTSTKINTAGWKEGVYLVRARYKGELLSGKLMIKK